MCTFVSVADFELEQMQPKHLNHNTVSSFMDRIMVFGSSSSSEEENPLTWDPVMEACNKHVALSQVDSGKCF